MELPNPFNTNHYSQPQPQSQPPHDAFASYTASSSSSGHTSQQQPQHDIFSQFGTPSPFSNHAVHQHFQQNTGTGNPPVSAGPAEQSPHTYFPPDAFANQQNGPRAAEPPPHLGDHQFDIIEWYPKYQSCQKYFVNHAQQTGPVQAVTAFVNIRLPFERSLNAIAGPSPRLSPDTLTAPPDLPHQSPSAVSLIPYLRRLVVTGLDNPGVLHGFFGDDWASGVGPLHEQERRNYLFAAKSGGWASVKKDYDMLPMETVPFMRPLQRPVIAEIEGAEKSWSEWLAMEDWMVGPRAPPSMDAVGAQARARGGR